MKKIYATFYKPNYDNAVIFLTIISKEEFAGADSKEEDTLLFGEGAFYIGWTELPEEDNYNNPMERKWNIKSWMIPVISNKDIFPRFQ